MTSEARPWGERALREVFGSEARARVLAWLCGKLENISPKLIFQQRDEWVRGQTPCHLGLLKPLVGADGYVYPCCGIQYSEIPGTAPWTLPHEARMCHWEDFGSAQPFDGTQCAKCYYDDYNKILDLMVAKVGHRDFV